MINPQAMPQEMKDRPQWVVWQIETRDGKETKVPYQPGNPSKKASSTDSATWGTFEQALSVAKTNGFGGIGYVFSPDDDYAGVDLDKCRDPETGEIEPWAKENIDRLASYSELSPSSCGFHIIVKGTVPPGGNKKGKTEMYSQGRYFTMTGNHYPGTPSTIEARQSELAALHEKVFGKPAAETEKPKNPSPDQTPAQPTEFSDHELINKACTFKNGMEFSALWLGYTSGYPSHSEADQAFCNRLAWLTGKDAERMDRLFRQSGLMRDKWDEYRGDRTYGAITIAKAIADCREVWKGAKRKAKRKQSRPQASESAGKDESEPNSITELNKKHAVIMIGGKCLIMNETINPTTGLPDTDFSSFADFRNKYSNVKVPVTTEDGTSWEPISKVWIASRDRRQYEGIIFLPGEDIPGYFNLFRGFPIKPQKGDWSLLFNHIFEVICSRDQDYFKYLLAWMARPIQDPGGERTGTSIAMRGKQGTGKGRFAYYYGQLFGNHYIHIMSPNLLTGRFNSHHKDKLLIFADEAFWAGDKVSEGIIKGLITEDTITVEGKGKDAYSIKNHIHLLIASNSNWVIPAGLEERRFFVLDVSDKHQKDIGYFAAIHRQMTTGGLEGMMYDLLELDISDVDLRTIPRTEALMEQIAHSMSLEKKFWFECLRSGTLVSNYGWQEYVVTGDFYKEYLGFVDSLKGRHPLMRELFIKEIKKLCPSIGHWRPNLNNERKYCLKMPYLDTCREDFEKITGIKLNWDLEQEEEGGDDTPF